MNYITEQLCFLRFIRCHKLSAGEIALWHALFGASNSQGLGHDFSVSNKSLQGDCGLGETRFKEAKKGLVEAGLLICFPYTPGELRTYRLTSLEEIMNGHSDPKNFLPESESDQTSVQTSDQPSDRKGDQESDRKSDPHYINKNINIKQKQEEKREAFGPFENVMLTERELESLHSLLPNAEELICRMSRYLESSGRQYRNHYAALLTWAEEDKAKKMPAQTEAEETQALEDAIGRALVKKYKTEIASKQLTNTAKCDNIVSNTRSEILK